jgi:hypothetical protein
MTQHARAFAEARSQWRIDPFDPHGPPAQAALARIVASPPSRRSRRALSPRRLAGALAAAVVGVAAIAIPPATPDVIARAASALEGEPGQRIVYSGDMRFGTGADRSGGETVHLEGNAEGMNGSVTLRGENVRGPEFGWRIPISDLALVELRELLEAARDGRSDKVDYVGETDVDGRAVHELRMTHDAGVTRTLFVDREDYLPVRFEQTGPGSQWAILDFTEVEWVDP